MENPIKMDDLGIPLFLETPNESLHKPSLPNILWVVVWIPVSHLLFDGL